MSIIFIVSDIFGITLALKRLVTELTEKLSDPSLMFIIVDPYNGQLLNFKNEVDAYAYFTQHSSIEKYAKHLSDILMQPRTTRSKIAQNSSHNNCKVIGFSVGASAMWSLADNVDLQVEHAIYFYGSQIRHFLNVKPNIRSTMIFPKQEERFDVKALTEQINNKENVMVKPCSYYHGFMNKHSINFNSQAYRTYLVWLSEQLN
jgi:dienelactone hydrolase